jgi:hypothetical protein
MNAVLSPISNIDPLAAAVEAYIDAKRREDLAKKQRIEIEECILALSPAKEEGSQTIEVAGYKVTTTGKLTYKCDDVKALAEACGGWPANMVPVKTEVKLDETGCKWLRANDPGAWASLARHITVAPAKTAVSVKV